jgi:hypothetical protein
MTAQPAQKIERWRPDDAIDGASPPTLQRPGQNDPNICDNLIFEQLDHSAVHGSDDLARIDAKTIAEVRKHQQADLARLRDAFRSVIEVDADKKPAVTCGELNQLASAVARIHSDERELYGITPPEPLADDTHDEDLSKLTNKELLELCYKEGIAPSCEYDTPTTKTPDPRTGPA